MKTNKRCPKCESTQIVQLAGESFMSKIYPFGLHDTGYSRISRFACTDCGFVEEYLVDPEELAELKQALE